MGKNARRTKGAGMVAVSDEGSSNAAGADSPSLIAEQPRSDCPSLADAPCSTTVSMPQSHGMTPIKFSPRHCIILRYDNSECHLRVVELDACEGGGYEGMMKVCQGIANVQINAHMRDGQCACEGPL